MKFAFIQTQLASTGAVQSHWNREALCRILGVSRSGYSAWQRRQKQPLSEIQQGIRVSRKRVARLMREEGLVGRSRARRRVQTTDLRHSYRVADNLLERRFTPQEVARPDRFWCGDITYLPTAGSPLGRGWVYLATVKDLFSRRILGWAVDDSLEATLVATAWQRALKTRGFAALQGPELYRSDRGSQYCGTVFQDLLKGSGTQPSMSGKGECLDNAAGALWVGEIFFGTLKAELLADQPERRFASKTQATPMVGDYIDNFYNSTRKHAAGALWAGGNKCPIAFELAYQINIQQLLFTCPFYGGKFTVAKRGEAPHTRRYNAS